MDKALAKHIFRAEGLPVAPDVLIANGRHAVAEIRQTLGDSVVVKPARQGSAIGVTFCGAADDLDEALRTAAKFDDLVLVERRVTGKEITVAILEDENGPRALDVVEIVTPEGTWYDFHHRYTEGEAEHVLPAPLPPDVYRLTQDIALRAHVALGCRDLSRADFVVSDDAGPILLEVNTLPGMTPTSLFPDAALAAGLDFQALVAHLVERAWSRR